MVMGPGFMTTAIEDCKSMGDWAVPAQVGKVVGQVAWERKVRQAVVGRRAYRAIGCGVAPLSSSDWVKRIFNVNSQRIAEKACKIVFIVLIVL